MNENNYTNKKKKKIEQIDIFILNNNRKIVLLFFFGKKNQTIPARFIIRKNHIKGSDRFRGVVSKDKSHVFFGHLEPLIKTNRSLIF